MITDEICKCCGQTLPPTVFHNIKMPKGSMQILEMVAKAGPHGMSSERLFNMLYAHRRDGGPETGMKCLHVRISHLNKKIRPHGFEVRATHPGWHAFGDYRLINHNVV